MPSARRACASLIPTSSGGAAEKLTVPARVLSGEGDDGGVMFASAFTPGTSGAAATAAESDAAESILPPESTVQPTEADAELPDTIERHALRGISARAAS
jgi:hypothetical protein